MPFGQCPETAIAIFLEQPKIAGWTGSEPSQATRQTLILARLRLRPAILLHLELLYISGLFSSIFDGSRKKQPQTAVWKKKFHQLSANTKRWTTDPLPPFL